MKEISGISPELKDPTDLWSALFFGAWQSPENGFPIILLGGWKDDLICENHHHIQRIWSMRCPPLNTLRISFPRKYPFKTIASLELQGFIIGDGKSNEGRFITKEDIFSYVSEKDWINWEIDYYKLDPEKMFSRELRGSSPDENKFDLIVGVWLADGRIFAENLELVSWITKLGESAARRSYSGGGPWPCLCGYEKFYKIKKIKVL